MSDAEGFTEAYDLDIDRVDLVGKAANGRKFVLLKAAAGGLVDPETMADLIKDDPTPEVRNMITKAKGDAVTVVFDQNGRPLGVIDPKDLKPITPPAPGTKPAPAQPPAAAPAPPGDAETAQAVQEAAADVAKAVRGVQMPAPASLSKSIGTIEGAYKHLVDRLPADRADLVASAVTRLALRLAIGSRPMPMAKAVESAKSVALDAAVAEARRPAPTVQNAAAVVGLIHTMGTR